MAARPPSPPVPQPEEVERAGSQAGSQTAWTETPVEQHVLLNRPLEQTAVCVNYASGALETITDPYDRRAWEDTRNQQLTGWTAAAERENITQARESGLTPSWCMSFGRFETIYASYDRSTWSRSQVGSLASGTR